MNQVNNAINKSRKNHTLISNLSFDDASIIEVHHTVKPVVIEKTQEKGKSTIFKVHFETAHFKQKTTNMTKDKTLCKILR